MGSRRIGNDVDPASAPQPWVEQTYAAAQAWVDRCLRANDSLFTPGRAIWTPQGLGELRWRFLDRPDESGDDFYTKLERQLAGSPPQVYQLMGEVLYVYYLILAKAGDKRQRIEQVLGWASLPAIPPCLADGLQAQFIGLGAGITFMPYQVGTLIEFVEQWKELDSGEQEGKLSDHWSFKKFLFTIHFTSQLLADKQSSGKIMKDVLLHIVFPDWFETIGENAKTKIANAFACLAEGSPDDVDHKVMRIRQSIESALARNFNFYEPDIQKLWGTGKQLASEELASAFAKIGNSNECDIAAELASVVTKTGNSGEYDLAALAKDLYLDAPFLEEIDALLKDKRQVIFQGPPGTGKTYVACALARHLAGADERVTLVQFHPSYAYEDFVQGFRPTLLGDGQAGFELKDGPLLRAARRAEAEPDAKHFLVIDEINRGNLAKALGELYFLLEYRNSEISLQYSDKPFRLPGNLYIIGTMNTADRSIALVDLALRRRFYFVEFHPDEPPIKGLLRRYLEANAPGMEWVAEVVDLANDALRNDREAAIGPSYFMRSGLDEDVVKRIWKHSVLPYIEERLFGESDDRRGEFDLDRLRQAVARETASAGDDRESAENGVAPADESAP